MLGNCHCLAELFEVEKSAKGKLTPAQEEWLADLRRIPNVEVYVWRPENADRIAEVLR